MGFIRRIARGIGRIARGIGSAIRRMGLKGILKLAGGVALSFMTGGVGGALLGGLKGLAGSALSKGVLGTVMKSFGGNFLSNIGGWLSKGPLAGLSGMLGNLKNVGGLTDTFKTLGNVIGGFKNQPMEVRQNAAELATHQHADLLAQQLWQMLQAQQQSSRQV